METVSAEDGTRIAYDRTGRGEPVILVAGAFSYRTYSGQVKLAGLLSQRLRRSDADTAPACRRCSTRSSRTAPDHTRSAADLVAERLGHLALRARAEPADLRGQACPSLVLLGCRCGRP